MLQAKHSRFKRKRDRAEKAAEAREKGVSQHNWTDALSSGQWESTERAMFADSAALCQEMLTDPFHPRPTAQMAVLP
jgi:hypothetical protein